MNKNKRKQKFNRQRMSEKYSTVISDILIDSLIYNMVIFQVSMSSPKSLLDLGSQEGQLANRISDNIGISDITCVDLSEHAVMEGKKKYPTFDWICSDMLDLSLQKKYDAVLISHAYFYMETEERIILLKNMDKILNDNGCIYICFGDINFEKRSVTPDYIVQEVASIFDIVNVLKSYEYIPINNVYTDFNSISKMWFTYIMARKKTTTQT